MNLLLINVRVDKYHDALSRVGGKSAAEPFLIKLMSFLRI